MDLQPLSRVESKGFLHVAQKLIDFGARFGSQPAQDVIQHRTTLQRYTLPEICVDLDKNLKTSLQNIPAYPDLCFTTDLWTETYQCNKFLSLSIHFIDANWVLHKKLLGIDLYEDTKTTSNMRSDCARIIGKYYREDCIDKIMEKSTAVTDGEAGMAAVFQNREPCQCHNINLFCEWSFSDKKPIDPEKIAKRQKSGNPYLPEKLFNLKRDCPQIADTIKGVKEVVTHFKQSHLNSKLTNTLKQEVCTRFNSLLFVLSSYKKSAGEVKSILIETQRLDLIVSISDDIVKALVNFLTPFNAFSEKLSADKYPTINLIALYYFRLRNHIQIADTDSSEMQTLKVQVQHCFNKYCATSNLHYMANKPNWRDIYRFACPNVILMVRLKMVFLFGPNILTLSSQDVQSD